VAVGALTTVAIVGVMGWTMSLGSFPIPFGDVLVTAFGGGTGEFDVVVRTLRLPRTLAALGVGIALAVSGAVFQGLVRNPLVAPDIIGVTSGASLAAVTAIVVFRTPTAVPLGALAGALAAAVLVYALTWRGGISGNRLVLVGIGINAVLTAATTLVLVRFPVEEIAPAILWTTGTLYGRTWGHVLWLAVGLLVLVPSILLMVPRFRTLQLGDAAATALGDRPEVTRTVLLALGAATAGVAVAVAGPVGFVALMVPHAARMLLGSLSGGVLVVTGLLGGLLVLVSDLIAQHALPTLSLPVGVVTAAVGAPYFLFLLHRTNRGHR
jgi:iron complex transport system permease protein